MPTADPVVAHYARGGLAATVLAALAAAGVDPEHPGPDDLAPLEEFHTLGRPATLELAGLAGVTAGMRVLDVGAGIGGPARLLARRHGCHVTALDLTAEFCEVSRLLTERTGLGDRVDVRQGDALDLPFDDGSFDLVWTQHAAMNIADKARLYAEMHRVLVPGGRLALYDVVAGGVAPIHLPVPWAERAEISHLVTPGALLRLLAEAGFEVVVWEDLTEVATAWMRRLVANPDPPPLGLHLLVSDLPRKAANWLRNLEEDRTRLLRAVARR
jgi:MPBQ/MSBQ methyltransferase